MPVTPSYGVQLSRSPHALASNRKTGFSRCRACTSRPERKGRTESVSSGGPLSNRQRSATTGNPRGTRISCSIRAPFRSRYTQVGHGSFRNDSISAPFSGATIPGEYLCLVRNSLSPLTSNHSPFSLSPLSLPPLTSNPSPSFFFQAEDGIRDYRVTGVQTCALLLSARKPELAPFLADDQGLPAARRRALR